MEQKIAVKPKIFTSRDGLSESIQNVTKPYVIFDHVL